MPVPPQHAVGAFTPLTWQHTFAVQYISSHITYIMSLLHSQASVLLCCPWPHPANLKEHWYKHVNQLMGQIPSVHKQYDLKLTHMRFNRPKWTHLWMCFQAESQNLLLPCCFICLFFSPFLLLMTFFLFDIYCCMCFACTVWGGKVGSMFSGPKPVWVQLSQTVTLLWWIRIIVKRKYILTCILLSIDCTILS